MRAYPERWRRTWRWAKREAYAWWPGLPFGLSARIHRTMRRLRWEQPRIKVERLGIRGRPLPGKEEWLQVKRARTKKVRDVLERKDKGK